MTVVDGATTPDAKRLTGRILVWDPPHVLEHEWPGLVKLQNRESRSRAAMKPVHGVPRAGLAVQKGQVSWAPASISGIMPKAASLRPPKVKRPSVCPNS